jgi:hypothetical protein
MDVPASLMASASAMVNQSGQIVFCSVLKPKRDRTLLDYFWYEPQRLVLLDSLV